MPQAENFYVAVRIRPFSKKEHQQKGSPIIEINTQEVLHFDPPQSQPNSEPPASKQVLEREAKNLQFEFDRIYDEVSTNNEIFVNSVKPLVETFMTGVNCAVFAYGATASGKTYTVFGSQQDGLIFEIIDEIFDQLVPDDVVEQEFIEIYNEQIRDLLVPEQTSLQLREDPIQGCFIPGSVTQQITSKAQAFENVSHAFSQRETNSTDENAASSRSHSIMFITVKRGTWAAKFAVTDLAGSERLKRTNAVGVRAFEGGNINKSLLALGNCLEALCKSNAYVPYRNSKLTRLLKDSLSGNSRVCMVANVSPAPASFDDTLNTLCYAQRASLIKTQAKVNIVAFQYTTAELNEMIEEYKEENAMLENEVKEARAAAQHAQGGLGGSTEGAGPAVQPAGSFEQCKNGVFSLLQQILVIAREYYNIESERKFQEFSSPSGAQKPVGQQEIELKSQIAQLKQQVLEAEQSAIFKSLSLLSQDNIRILIENGQSCLAQIAEECYIAFLERKSQAEAQQLGAAGAQMQAGKAAFEELVMVAEVCGVGEDELKSARARFSGAFQVEPSAIRAPDLQGATKSLDLGEEGDITLNELDTNQIQTTTFNLTETVGEAVMRPPTADLRRAANLRSFRARRVPGLMRPAERKYDEQIGELEKQLSAIGSTISRQQSRVKSDQK